VHTRQAEEFGRAEMLGAGVIGRYASLAAAVLVALAANVVLAVLLGLGMVVAGQPAAGSLVAGSSIALVGVAFTGVAALTSQLASTTRGATGLAGAGLGVSFMLAALGNMLGSVDSAALRVTSAWPAWLSPIGWGQQMRPFADNLWWPSALALTVMALLFWFAVALGIQPWVYVMVYAAFAVQGAALAVAFACYVRARWGQLLGERTGDLLARPSAQVRPWPESHLPQMAEVVAAMTVAVTLVCAYWAAGGSIGLSDARPHDSFGMQAARVAGAVIAAAGLFALAGRWGHRARFWLPAALTWIGSGALAAFDSLTLVTNRLFSMFGTALPEPDWAPIDTVLVIKAAIGVLAAAVGGLAATAAAKNNQKPART
jgi:hypothetical protein